MHIILTCDPNCVLHALLPYLRSLFAPHHGDVAVWAALAPGVRIVGGRAFYSAAWLNDPKILPGHGAQGDPATGPAVSNPPTETPRQALLDRSFRPGGRTVREILDEKGATE